MPFGTTTELPGIPFGNGKENFDGKVGAKIKIIHESDTYIICHITSRYCSIVSKAISAKHYARNH